MRCGNRLNLSSLTRWRRRNLEYHTTLREQSLSHNNPLVAYFGREVFHDGVVLIKNLDLKRGHVTLVLRNVHAVNRVVKEMARQNRRTKRLLRSDFVTLVRFEGLTEFQMSPKKPVAVLEYECAELGRKNGRYSLEIRCRRERG